MMGGAKRLGSNIPPQRRRVRKDETFSGTVADCRTPGQSQLLKSNLPGLSIFTARRDYWMNGRARKAVLPARRPYRVKEKESCHSFWFVTTCPTTRPVHRNRSDDAWSPCVTSVEGRRNLPAAFHPCSEHSLRGPTPLFGKLLGPIPKNYGIVVRRSFPGFVRRLSTPYFYGSLIRSFPNI